MKFVCAKLRHLDIRRLHRKRLLRPGNVLYSRWTRGSINIDVKSLHSIVLRYSIPHDDGERRQVECPVDLVWTPVHLGGQRPYFQCPACARRCLLLYSRAGQFKCRTCHDLVYKTQRVDKSKRMQFRTNKIAMKLDWTDDNMSKKPKHMHRKTFDRLQYEHCYYDLQSLIALCEKFRCLPT